MTGRRDPLNRIERLLGLPPLGVRDVRRNRDGSYSVVLRPCGHAPMPRWVRSRRVLRIPARRVAGYRPRSSCVRPRDARARAKANAHRFAWWLFERLGHTTPVVERAVFGGDLDAVEELRHALRAAAPDPVVFVVIAGSNGGGEWAA